MNKKLDSLFEKLTKLIGSTVVILASMAWCTHAYVKGNRDFLDVVSMVTFIFGEFILRGQNVQDERTDKNVRKDLELSRKVLEKV